MLPEITLRDITAKDVDRIALWLEDEEVSNRWFGYAGTDPLHRGYDPVLMQMASESEWDLVFRGDPQLLVSTIYSENDERIGECQMVLVRSSKVEERNQLWNGRDGPFVPSTGWLV